MTGGWLLALASSSSPTLAAAIIAAVASLVSAGVALVVGLRATSAKQLVSDLLAGFKKLLEEELHEQLDAQTRGLIIGEIVKRALREVLGSRHGGRRWYDPDDDD